MIFYLLYSILGFISGSILNKAVYSIFYYKLKNIKPIVFQAIGGVLGFLVGLLYVMNDYCPILYINGCK